MEENSKLGVGAQKLVKGKKPTKPKMGPMQDDTIVQYLYKTKMCYHWQSGYCLMGNNCNFAHGIHELRIPRTFTLVNDKGQEVAVPDNIFNPDVTAALQNYGQVPGGGGSNQPVDQETYHRALTGALKEDEKEGGELGIKLGNLSLNTKGGNGDSKANSKVDDLLEVEGGKLAETILQKNNSKPDTAVEENQQKYFQIEGNHDKPFGENFNGTPVDSSIKPKPLKMKIGKQSSGDDQAESVQTPKWAGWLLDTPHDTGNAGSGPAARGGGHVPEDTCPMCGDRAVETKDSGVQCTLIE